MACTDSDYAYLRALVLEQSANLIDPSRNALFDTRLTPIAQLAGASNLEDFVNILKVDRPEHLRRAVAEAMTINETSFFRDLRPFEMLRETILPRLIESRTDVRRLRIWSAASSTGQEAYSLAMMMVDHFPGLAGWDVKIIGTDISRQVIDYARRGRYRRLEVNRGLPARMLLKSVYDLAEAAGIRSGIAEECAAVFSATRPEAAVSGCLSADRAGWVSNTGKCGAGGGFVGSFRGGVRFERVLLSSTSEIAVKVA